MRHYTVQSREYCEQWSSFEPPEYFSFGCIVLAENSRDAKIKALKDPEMAGHLKQARKDGCNPFSGLSVKLSVCEHNVCWGCMTDDEVEKGKSRCFICSLPEENLNDQLFEEEQPAHHPSPSMS